MTTHRDVTPGETVEQISRFLSAAQERSDRWAMSSDQSDAYVRSWMVAEEDDRHSVGFPDWHARPALIALVEAARAVCGMEYEQAAELALIATEEIAALIERKGSTGD